MAGDLACPRRTFVVLVGVAVAVLCVPVSAAHAESVTVLAQVQSVDQVLTNIRNWIMGILALLATVIFTIGGVRRVMAGGDPGEHEKAKDCFKAAAIGYGLAALAPLVVSVLKGIVGA
ncbi:pilin [Lentzea albidocapillata]|uniref:pilin n=1 Tax=Lentzea albidocapillata TaxID=40571 RepID=UPI00210DEAA8|nr:pilin [Lentzea albidocapillata]